jgi:hypothetical protein
MKFHKTLVDELARIFEIHGGHREEWRLKNELAKLQLTVYKQASGVEVLVSSRHLKEYLITRNQKK